MAHFLSDSDLNSSLAHIFKEAKKELIIISPFIKLHPRLINILKNKKDTPDLNIVLVFGKNENRITKSLQYDDFKLLKEFPNVKIFYEPRLHAKFYANESSALLSSMNLYDYSLNNNIEFGIYIEGSILQSVANNLLGNDTLDRKAFQYFGQVVKNSKLLFKATPLFKKTLGGLSKQFLKSEISVDKLSEMYESTTQKPEKQLGYCIRSGERIPFDLTRPLSEKAYQAWNKFKDESYPEKYCHYSGEPSEGKTSLSRPVLHKYWKQAFKSSL